MSHDVIIPVETTDNPHNGRPITKIELSPKSQYLVTYSEEDHTIVGWNVKDIDEGKLKLDISVKISDTIKNLNQMRISDDKKLVYIYNDNKSIEIIDLNNDQKIELYFCKHLTSYYCVFNLKDEFILYSDINHSAGDNKIIWICSTQTKNNKWTCKKIYMISDDVELLSISKYDKLYLISNDCIYELNILTGKSMKIFVNKNELEAENVKILCNEIFICLKIDDKIIIYSVELGNPIVSLDINNDTQLYNFMKHPGLNPLLLSLFSLFDDVSSSEIWNSIMEDFWKEFLKQLKENNKLPNEYNGKKLPILPILFDYTTKYAFGILDGFIWKIKFKFDKRFSLKHSNELNGENDESWNVKCDYTYEYLSILLYTDTIYAFIKKAKSYKDEHELIQDLIKWKIKIENEKIKLEVLNKDESGEWNSIITRIENFNIIKRKGIILRGIKLYNNGDIVILTTIGLLIYHLNENNKSIFLKYFYFTDLYLKNSPTKQDIAKYQEDEEKYKQTIKKCMNILRYHYKKVFLNSTLPISNYNSFKSNDEWVSFVIDNKESLLKNGVELLKFAIKEHNLELVEDIYKKCISYFKQDLRNNKIFLSIVTSTSQILNEYYPEYISKYSSETTMIIDSPLYNIEYQSNDLHLYSFSQNPQLFNLSQSILWTKYQHSLFIITEKRKKKSIVITILFAIQLLILLLMLPIFIPTFFILSKYYFINDIYRNDIFSGVYFDKVLKFLKISSKHISIPTITFMVPYIKFVNYPQDYKWVWELIRPQPSPFAETINREIYKTWNGEALINFKWNTYGKYYYAIIWIGFIALLGCFTIVAIPQQHIDITIQKQLLITSIILGFIHLSFEIRQIIYNPIKWIRDIWNLFVFNNEITDPNQFMMEQPNENTNMFTDYGTSLFAMYLFLTGDSSVLSNWSYKNNPPLVILMVSFSFLIVVYLMNLFIGLLNMAIEKDKDRVSYLIQKAEILAEIELFYLLPYQRRWQTWFPEVIYYYANVDKTREKVKQMISNGKWNTDGFPELKQELLNKLNIQNNPVN
ncbi:hypothetical protein RhiirB3_467953 [Rhizophagus irregularis]|nr:hypothetical protein RhiirB3_467953 [Rhizophagus irregularis]